MIFGLLCDTQTFKEVQSWDDFASLDALLHGESWTEPRQAARQSTRVPDPGGRNWKAEERPDEQAREAAGWWNWGRAT